MRRQTSTLVVVWCFILATVQKIPCPVAGTSTSGLARASSISLHKWQPELALNGNLLFLLQLIGPDCVPDQRDLPQHLTASLRELLDTVNTDTLGLLNFTSPNGQLPEPGRVLLEADLAQHSNREPERLLLQTGPPLADEQPHHFHHHQTHRSALRRLLQGMNSHEPALMFLYEAQPQHDPAAVHIQLSDIVASGRLGNAIRDKGIKLSDIHLVAYEPEYGPGFDTPGISEFQAGPLNHMVHGHDHDDHRHFWHVAIFASCSLTIIFCMAKHAKRVCRRRKRKAAGIASQLSELSAKSAADTTPNPLLQGPLALAVHNTDVIPKSDTDWIQNVPWSDWQIDQEDITICHRPDGRLWELGSGASAKVYRAMKSGVQVVAAKVFSESDSSVTSSSTGCSRSSIASRVVSSDVFKQEIAILKSCHDRNIVQFVGACLQPDCTIMVMEYLESGDLYHAIANDSTGRFSWYKRDARTGVTSPGMGRRIALDVARGLHFLHARSVVHFDLKSANILLARDYTAKIADVGLAKIMQQQFLSTLYCVGTFAWAAPEVLLGKPGCTEKVDMYSYGVVLWEICTGESPTGRQLRPVRVPEECPQEVADVIASCLDENPENRPTARRVIDQLGALKEPRGASH